MKKGISVIVLLSIIIALLVGSGYLILKAVNAKNQEVKNPILSLDIEDYGTVKIELYPEYAPNTVKNIITLANNGYYNGKIFYGMDDVAVYVGRGADGKTVNPTIDNINNPVENKSENKKEDKSKETQNDVDKEETDTSATDELDEDITDEEENIDDEDIEDENDESESKNEDDYEYEIDGEFVANGYRENTLKHEKGVVSLVRADYTKQIQSLTTQSYNSGNSQFTIIMGNASQLNGMYAGFGRVKEGMEIVEKIYGLETKKAEEEQDDAQSSEDEVENSINAFSNAPVIRSATVETYGIDYGKPETHEAFDYSAYLSDLMQQYYSSQQ